MTIGSYFAIPSWLLGDLLKLNIDKHFIINIMIGSCLLFLYTSVIFALQMKLETKIKWYQYLIFLLPLVMEYIIFEPSFYLKVYGFFYSYYTIEQISFVRTIVITTARVINAGYCLLSSILSIWAYFKFYKYRFTRYSMASIILSFNGALLIYLVVFYQVPDFFMVFSKTTGYISYKIFTLSSITGLYRLLPFIVILFLSIITIAMVIYNFQQKRMRFEEFQLNRDINNSALVARTFSHYMKNEMLSIIASVDFVQSKQYNPKIVQDTLQKISDQCRAACQHLTAMTNNMTRVRLVMKKENVLLLLDRLILEYKEKYPEINFKYNKKTTTYAMIDEEYFKEAVNQLVQNSVDALLEKNPPQKIIEFANSNVNQWVIISLSDNGGGISQKELGKIFMPFYSTKPKKTNWGYGLSIFHSIIRLHDGHVSVDSELGHGTTFSIFLPNLQ